MLTGVWPAVRTALQDTGEFTLFFFKSLRASVSRPFRARLTLDHMFRLGVQSLPLVTVFAAFTGMVLALQTAYQIKKFGADVFVGGIVGLSIVRELGPVLTALILAGRVGSGIASELGSMRVTEQIDAIDMLGTDAFHYLVGPRVLACALMGPVLAIYFDFVGNLGGYIVSLYKVGVDPHVYLENANAIVGAGDILSGLLKMLVFSVIVAVVGCYYGFRCAGGAAGVGVATTSSVVTAFLLVIVFDYFLSSFFYIS